MPQSGVETDVFARLAGQVDVKTYDEFCDAVAKYHFDDEVFLTKLSEFVEKKQQVQENPLEE